MDEILTLSTGVYILSNLVLEWVAFYKVAF